MILLNTMVRPKKAPLQRAKSSASRVTATWFRDRGAPDGDKAFAEYSEWLAKHPQPRESSERRVILRLASGLADSSIGHYMAPGRRHKLSEKTRRHLAEILRELGQEPDDLPVGPLRYSGHGPRRLALIAEFTHAPSTPYIFAVTRSVAAEAARRNVWCSLHDLAGRPFEDVLAGVIASARPNALALLRLTPSDRILAMLARADLPTALIHADRGDYPYPIVVNVIPDHKYTASNVAQWCRGVRDRETGQQVRGISTSRKRLVSDRGWPSDGPIVLITMPYERSSSAPTEPTCTNPCRVELVPPESQLRRSVRNERILKFRTGISERENSFEHVVVPDYAFRHAAWIVREFADSARGYICLSDEIALGVRLLLEGRGRDCQGRVLGYDDSWLASVENLSSFDQGLGRIGDAVLEHIFAETRATSASLPQFGTESLIEVTLKSRGN